MAHKRGEPWGMFNWGTLAIGVVILIVALVLL